MYSLLDIPIIDSSVRLRDVATIRTKYLDESEYHYGTYLSSGYIYLPLSVEKTAGSNIFTVATTFKQNLNQLLQKEEFQSINASYVQDMADTIQDDYDTLAKN